MQPLLPEALLYSYTGAAKGQKAKLGPKQVSQVASQQLSRVDDKGSSPYDCFLDLFYRSVILGQSTPASNTTRCFADQPTASWTRPLSALL